MARIVLWAILLYVLWRVAWRLLKGVFQGMGYQRPGDTNTVGLVRDPNCGTFVVPSHALTTGSGTSTRYFCSEKCKREYAAKH